MNPKDKKSFFSLLFVVAMDNFGFGLVFVMFAPLLLMPESQMLPAETSTHIRNLFLGILFAVFPLAQLFGAPLFGDLADYIGRKKGLYLTIAGSVLGYLLSGIGILFSSIGLLIFSRLITGFFSGNLSICLAGIADLSSTEKLRARNFSIVTVVWGFTWPLAMLSGGYLADPTLARFTNPALPFWITAFLTLLSYFAIAKYFSETHEPKENVKFNFLKGLHNIKLAFDLKALRGFFIVIFLWTLGWGLSIQWFSAYSILEYKMSQTTISWALIAQGAFWMLGGGP